MTVVRWALTILLFAAVAICLAITIVPRFLDQVYYRGPISDHFDGELFAGSDGLPVGHQLRANQVEVGRVFVSDSPVDGGRGAGEAVLCGVFPAFGFTGGGFGSGALLCVAAIRLDSFS